MMVLGTDCIGKCFLRKAPRAPLRRQMQEQFFPHATENTQDTGDHCIDIFVCKLNDKRSCCRPEALCLPLVLTYPQHNLLSDS